MRNVCFTSLSRETHDSKGGVKKQEFQKTGRLCQNVRDGSPHQRTTVVQRMPAAPGWCGPAPRQTLSIAAAGSCRCVFTLF
jgi:hypothetical protein